MESVAAGLLVLMWKSESPVPVKLYSASPLAPLNGVDGTGLGGLPAGYLQERVTRTESKTISFGRPKTFDPVLLHPPKNICSLYSLS